MLFSVMVNSPAAAPGAMRADRSASPVPTMISGARPPSMPGMRASTVNGWPALTLADPGTTVMT